jgi:zinc protease
MKAPSNHAPHDASGQAPHRAWHRLRHGVRHVFRSMALGWRRWLALGMLGLGLGAGSLTVAAQAAGPQAAAGAAGAVGAAATVVPTPNEVLASGATRWQLPNGFTLIVQPDRRAPTAIHMVWLRVGSMDEVDGSSGVAHVVEHMLFKGTPRLAPGEFSRRVAALGGRENAFTARDYTGYFQQIPAERLADVMALEADRFAHNQWADVEFTREIEVVKEERRLRTDDNPRSRLFEQLSATVWQAHPYRRPIVGWMSDLDAMTPQDVRDFYRRWYVPANAAIVVVGDVDPAQVYRLALAHYGPIAPGTVPSRKPRTEPEQRGMRRIEHKAPAEQGLVALAFKVPQLSLRETTPQQRSAGDDALALSLLAAVLDGHSGARLARQLVQDRPGVPRVADSASASNGLWGRGPALFFLTGVPAPGRSTADVEAALREQVTRIAREGVAETELRRVKAQWLAGEVYKLDSLMNQARELGSYWALDLPLNAGEQLMQRARAVTAAQVQAVAQRYFGDDQLTVGTLVALPPEPGQAPRRPAAALRH